MAMKRILTTSQREQLLFNWEHITFLGEYKFDLLSIPKHLRELNIKNK